MIGIRLIPAILKFIIFLAICHSSIFGSGNKAVNQEAETGKVNITQAELMLEFLEVLAANKTELEIVNKIVEAEGTDLIVGQMNLARKVTKDQYRILLLELDGKYMPNI